MATCTAQITVGAPMTRGWAPEGVGIGPSHILYLIESGRAAWAMEPVTHPGALDEGLPAEVRTWIPRAPETILADGLLMVAALLEGDGAVRDALIGSESKSYGGGRLLDVEWADLGELEPELVEEAATAAAKTITAKLVITAMYGSSLTGQLAMLERCSMDVEVCVPTWVRSRDDDGEVHIAGNLPPEDPNDHRFTAVRI